MLPILADVLHDISHFFPAPKRIIEFLYLKRYVDGFSRQICGIAKSVDSGVQEMEIRFPLHYKFRDVGLSLSQPVNL